MKYLVEEKLTKLWMPNFIASDVAKIDFDHLKKLGVKACMFDLDHTLLVHGSIDMSTDTVKTLKNSGMKLYIATNRRNSPELDDIAAQMDAEGVMHAKSRSVSKPSKEYYSQALDMIDLRSDQVVMVGDRILQDIWGARRVGIRTILVYKFGKIKWFDQILTIHDRLLPKVFNKYYKNL